jgi:Bap31/Bap29 transmembrane region
MDKLTMLLAGLPASGDGDGGLCRPHHSTSVQSEAEALHLHIRESARSEDTIRHEGERCLSPADRLLIDAIMVQITFIFILILFLDSVNRVYRVQVELAAYSKEGGGAG